MIGGIENISFGASININSAKIKENILYDKYFGQNEKKQLKFLLKEVKSLSNLKEKSVVDIEPRLNNNQLVLITTVTNKSGTVQTTIPERSVRKLVSDDNFSDRFLIHIKQAIVNVEKTGKELQKISKFIAKSKNIRDEGFVDNLSSYFLDHLNKGNNATKRILTILKKLDKNNENTKFVALKSIKKVGAFGKTTKVQKYFSVRDSEGERLLPVGSLLKDPALNLFDISV